jgi:hypothetical protein
MHLNEVSKYIGNLLRTGQVRAERRNRSIYYSARREKTEPGSPA